MVCVFGGSLHNEAKPILYFGYLGGRKVLYNGHVGGRWVWCEECSVRRKHGCEYEVGTWA